ncbi:MFS transporter [Streptomyces griseorubiginosus]|uniref:MFS transporter n=1 Tax=Streptomyces griseorubiginosus TaxID=67304 RepID=UPI0033EF7758
MVHPEPDHSAGGTVTAAHPAAYLTALRLYPAQAWKAAIACALAIAFSPAGLSVTTTFAIGPVSRDFGWSRSATLTLFTLPLLIAPIVLPFGGRWVDRWGARAVALPSTVLYAVGTAAISMVGRSQAQLGLVLVVSSAVGYVASLAVVFKVILSWFPRHRGVGFGMIGVATSLGGTILSPICELLFRTMGWRGTYLVLALCVLVIALPAQVFLLSEPADVQQSRRDRSAARQAPHDTPPPPPLPGVSLWAAVRTRTWMSIVVLLGLAAAGAMSVRLNAVALLGERAYTETQVSLALSTMFLASIVGQLLAGFVLDRARTPRACLPFLGSVLVGLVILTASHGTVWTLFLGMALLGVTMGSESTIGPFLLGRYFGLRAFAQIQGLALALDMLMLGTIPVVVQAVKDQSGSFTPALFGLIGACALVVVMAALLPRYPIRGPEPGPPPHGPETPYGGEAPDAEAPQGAEAPDAARQP